MRCFGIKEFSCSFFLFTSYASWTGGDLSELRQQKLTANVEEREREREGGSWALLDQERKGHPLTIYAIWELPPSSLFLCILICFLFVFYMHQNSWGSLTEFLSLFLFFVTFLPKKERKYLGLCDGQPLVGVGTGVLASCIAEVTASRGIYNIFYLHISSRFHSASELPAGTRFPHESYFTRDGEIAPSSQTARLDLANWLHSY